MQVVIGTLVVFAVVTAAMSIGVFLSGRSLKGSCGGVANGACPCSEDEKRACAEKSRAA